MGQEAFAMFPALAEMQARSQLMRAQAGAVGQEGQLLQQKYGQDQASYGAFANAFNQPGGPALPGATSMTPQPGQVSVSASPPMDPWSTIGGRPGVTPTVTPKIRVPQAGLSAPGGDSGPGNQPGLSAPVATDELYQQGAAAVPPVPAPGAPSQPAAPHKWTPEPGAQYNTPDGSKPRSLDEVVAAIRKANPKADAATIGRAAALYLPWMTEEDQVRLREAQMETTKAVHEADAAQRAAASQLAADTKLDIAKQGDETRLAIAKQRVAAANQRAEQTNQRALKIAADVNALGQAKLDEARRSGDGRLALQAQKELRLQQATIAQVNDDYSRAMYNASLIQDADQQAVAIEAATQAREQGLDNLKALPNPTYNLQPYQPEGQLPPGATLDDSAPPTEPPATDPDALDRRFHNKGTPVPDKQSSLRRPGNSQLSLAEWNAKRRKAGLPARSAFA